MSFCYVINVNTNITKITRLAIPGFWPNARAPWKTGFSHQVRSWGCSKRSSFSWKILSAPGSWRHLMGRICTPVLAQTPGIANLLFQYRWARCSSTWSNPIKIFFYRFTLWWVLYLSGSFKEYLRLFIKMQTLATAAIRMRSLAWTRAWPSWASLPTKRFFNSLLLLLKSAWRSLFNSAQTMNAESRKVKATYLSGKVFDALRPVYRSDF